jgi:hypothetical protein
MVAGAAIYIVGLAVMAAAQDALALIISGGFIDIVVYGIVAGNDRMCPRGF